MKSERPDPESSSGRDNGTPSNRANEPAQGEEGLREDAGHEAGSRLDGPGFGKGSNAV